MWADNLDDRADDQRSGPAREGDDTAPGPDQVGKGPGAATARESPNLFDLLRSRVRAASDGQLVLSAVLGMAGLITMGVARRWPWAAIAACGVLIFAGLWGVLDRTHSATVLPGRGRALSATLAVVARVASGALALLALLALMLGVFGLCLGTWIS